MSFRSFAGSHSYDFENLFGTRRKSSATFEVTSFIILSNVKQPKRLGILCDENSELLGHKDLVSMLVTYRAKQKVVI